MSARLDPLARTMLLLGFVGLGVISWLAVDATQSRRAATTAAIATLPSDCPAPKTGEQLQIRIEVRSGKLDVACNTLRPFAPMRSAQ